MTQYESIPDSQSRGRKVRFFSLIFFYEIVKLIFFFSVHPDFKPAIVGHHQGQISEEGFKLTSATTPISASFGHQANMVDGMMSSAFAAAAAAHQDSLSRMTSMTNSIAPPQSHTSHTAGQILGNFTCSATKTLPIFQAT